MKALFPWETHKFVCLCALLCMRACDYRSLFGVKPVPNWLTTLCLWRDPLRYDYRLPRPHSQASWSETTHAAYQTEAFQVSLSVCQGLASYKGQLWREEQGANKHSQQANRQGKDKMREPHSRSLESKLSIAVTRQLCCCGNTEPQWWPIGRCGLSRCQQHRLTLNPSRFKAPEITGSRSKTWNVKLRQAQRIVVQTRSLTFQIGTSEVFLLWRHLFWGHFGKWAC